MLKNVVPLTTFGVPLNGRIDRTVAGGVFLLPISLLLRIESGVAVRNDIVCFVGGLTYAWYSTSGGCLLMIEFTAIQFFVRAHAWL
jgi:hypothetical protein